MLFLSLFVRASRILFLSNKLHLSKQIHKTDYFNKNSGYILFKMASLGINNCSDAREISRTGTKANR